jgi:Peptidase A4 family.
VFVSGSNDCASPPANFNPLTASKHDLLYYGLPVRPEGDTKLINSWLTKVQNAKHRDCSFITVHHNYPQNVNSALVRPNSIENTGTSNIWSGYVVGDGTPSGFNYVEGKWNNPCLNASKTPTGSQVANWVGLGGYSSKPGEDPGFLWQAGTEVETGPPASGSPQSPVYHMWYEAYPKEDWIVDTHPMNCGDHIYAEVDYNFTYSSSSYAYVHDSSNGLYIAVSDITWTPNLKYAEWIDERPSCPWTTNPHKLADFNYMDWSYAYAKPTPSNTVGPISAFTHTRLSMVDIWGNTIAYPLSLGSDGASFTDEFGNAGNGDGYCGS